MGAVDLLIIDDLRSEKKTVWSEQTIYTIIDERYSNRRSTLITTNLPLNELGEKVGPCTMDRLIGSCRIIKNGTLGTGPFVPFIRVLYGCWDISGSIIYT